MAGPPVPRIPRIFHFTFGLEPQRQPLHLVHYLCVESCRRVNQPECIYFYFHYEPYGRYWDLIRPLVVPVKVQLPQRILDHQYADAGVARYRHAHLADVVRLEQLLAHGGVYADLDTIFINPVPEHLFERQFVLGAEDDVVDQAGELHQSLCNAFILSAKNAAFGKVWLDEMLRRFDGSWSGHSCQLASRLSIAHPDLIHVEPSRTFYKHMWTRDGLRMLLEDCDADFNGVVSLHLWSHLWWDRRRRDFSDVHAGTITERHVRNVATTYNIAARPYLPEPERGGLAGLVGTALRTWAGRQLRS